MLCFPALKISGRRFELGQVNGRGQSQQAGGEAAAPLCKAINRNCVSEMRYFIRRHIYIPLVLSFLLVELLALNFIPNSGTTS
ncbi:hypothetical protein EON65_57965 [archaeon]|nr:MAG: hypothetical protein EON65_57965 [archaeon]